MAAIVNAVESFEADILHMAEGTIVSFVLIVTDDASGFDIDDDLIITSSDAAAPVVTKPMDADVTEDPGGTFKFNIEFPEVSSPTRYTVSVAAAGVTGLSADQSVTIAVFQNIEINHTYGQVLNFPVRITGNNVNQVDVQGLLAPLYHHWDPTTGMLYIRSIGAVETLYTDLEFTVSARDDDSLIDVGGVLNVMQPAPAIRLPTAPLRFYFGREIEVDLQIDNRPSKVEVIGTWFGLEGKRRPDGVRFEGIIPVRGTASGEGTPGVNSGDFLVIASNRGNDPVSAFVPWVLIEGKPQFGEQSFIGDAALNVAFTETIEIMANPEPIVVIESGALPTGLSLQTAYANDKLTVSFSGTLTATGTFTFKLRATNSDGATLSGDYTITVYTAFVAPSSRRNLPGPSKSRRRLLRRNQFPWNITRYFNRGVPEGTYSLVVTNNSDELQEGFFEITQQGRIRIIGNPATSGLAAFYNMAITVTNSEGSFTDTAHTTFGN